MKQKDKDSMKNLQRTKPLNRNHFSWLPQLFRHLKSKQIPKPLFAKWFAFSLKKRNDNGSIVSATDVTRQDTGALTTTLMSVLLARYAPQGMSQEANGAPTCDLTPPKNERKQSRDKTGSKIDRRTTIMPFEHHCQEYDRRPLYFSLSYLISHYLINPIL